MPLFWSGKSGPRSLRRDGCPQIVPLLRSSLPIRRISVSPFTSASGLPGLKLREAGFLENVHRPPMFAVRDLLKDLDLGLALYQPPVPLTFLARQLFAGVAARTPDLDISAIVNQYAKENAR